MIELHGWMTLRYSDYHSQDQPQRDFVAKFAQYLQQHHAWVLTEGHGLLRSNGLDSFTLAIQHNHPGEPLYPLAIFQWVAQESTGSYGLSYVHDDEDEQHLNAFQAYVLKRGQLVKTTDPFLSPYFEEVEREYDEQNPPLD